MTRVVQALGYVRHIFPPRVISFAWLTWSNDVHCTRVAESIIATARRLSNASEFTIHGKILIVRVLDAYSIYMNYVISVPIRIANIIFASRKQVADRLICPEKPVRRWIHLLQIPENIWEKSFVFYVTRRYTRCVSSPKNRNIIIGRRWPVGGSPTANWLVFRLQRIWSLILQTYRFSGLIACRLESPQLSAKIFRLLTLQVKLQMDLRKYDFFHDHNSDISNAPMTQGVNDMHTLEYRQVIADSTAIFSNTVTHAALFSWCDIPSTNADYIFFKRPKMGSISYNHKGWHY